MTRLCVGQACSCAGMHTSQGVHSPGHCHGKHYQVSCFPQWLFCVCACAVRKQQPTVILLSSSVLDSLSLSFPFPRSLANSFHFQKERRQSKPEILCVSSYPLDKCLGMGNVHCLGAHPPTVLSLCSTFLCAEHAFDLWDHLHITLSTSDVFYSSGWQQAAFRVA